MVTASLVHEVFVDSRPQIGDSPKNLVRTPWLHTQILFHNGRLHSHADKVRGALLELPPQFMSDEGCPLGEGCYDRRHKRWGDVAEVAELILLGIALGFAECLCDSHAPHFKVCIPDN